MRGNDEWLESLSVTDPIAIQESRNHFGCKYRISKVKRITPTGIIVTDCGSRFRKDGYERGGESWSRSKLRKPTDEIKEKIARYKAIVKINRAMEKTNLITTDGLIAMSKAIVMADQSS